MGYALSISTQLSFVTEECFKCNVLFAITRDFQERCLKDHSRLFYCPNGHPQAYIGKTELQKAQEALAAQTAETERQRRLRVDAEKRTIAQRGVVTRLQKRLHAGVCPHCQRTFKQLAAHMQSKHAETE